MERRSVLLVAGAVALVVVAAAVGVFVVMGSDEEAAPTTTTTTTQAPAPDPLERDRAAVVELIESLRPGSPVGFDPEVWAQAADTDAVLPEGATLEVEPDSVIVDGDTATADVVMSVPGREATRNWVFVRRLDGEWVVYGSMELELPA